MKENVIDRRIRILHVVGRMDRGGTEALLMNLLRTIDHTQFQFDFVEQTQDICDYDQEIYAYGGKIYRVPHITLISITKYRKWWDMFLKEHPEYHIIHGHSRGTAPIYLKEAQRHGRITILHCHSNAYGRGIKGKIRYIWQLPLRKLADYNFACSYDSGVSQFGRNGKFKVIKNGIPTRLYSWNPTMRKTKRQEFGLDDEELVIGNVARFEEPKNHKFLLKIFSEIQKINPRSKLLLVGQGTLEKAIRKQTIELGIEDHVIFTGVRSDVNELMQAMDVFVLPSYFEGLGIVNVEAQTAGLPCFVSDKVIPQEVNLTNLMHYIPLSASPKEWAQKILEEKINIKNRKDMSSKIIEAGFDIESTCNILCEFYKGLVNHE